MSQGSQFRRTLRERSAGRGRRLLFPEADDARTAAAVATILEHDICVPTLVGAPDIVRASLAAAGVEADVDIIDPEADLELWALRLQELRAHRAMSLEEATEHARTPLVRAALMVGADEYQGSVAGAANTSGDVVRAALWAVGPVEGIRTVSSAFYMTVRDFRGAGEETLTYTDAAVVQYPSTVQLADIAWAAADARRRVVGDEPIVAFLSHSTMGSASGPSIDRVREAVKLFRSRHPEIQADGEFQVDAALIRSIGERKAPGSAIAGRANILVFPDLDSANIAYKLTERLGGGEAVGPIMHGLRRPCNDLSRGASADDIVDVACVTALMVAD